MRSKLFTLIVSFAFLLIASAAVTNAQVVFKIPDGVFPIDWKNNKIKGVLMLEKDSPTGIFVSYPDEGESVEQLRERAAKAIAPMIGGPKEGEAVPFEITPLASNEGDIVDGGRLYLYKDAEKSVQILFFTRKTSDTTLLYGYFAQKSSSDKKSKGWVDGDMKIPKILAKFIKTFKG